MFAYYKVEWYYDCELTCNEGFVCGKSFAEMAQKVTEDYGEVEGMTLRTISDDENCLDLDDIETFFKYSSLMNEEAQSGAGPQVFEAIKQGLQEAIDGNYEEDLQE